MMNHDAHPDRNSQTYASAAGNFSGYNQFADDSKQLAYIDSQCSYEFYDFSRHIPGHRANYPQR